LWEALVKDRFTAAADFNGNVNRRLPAEAPHLAAAPAANDPERLSKATQPQFKPKV